MFYSRPELPKFDNTFRFSLNFYKTEAVNVWRVKARELRQIHIEYGAVNPGRGNENGMVSNF